jgi:hypothetical protein
MNSVVRTSIISAEPIALAAMKNWLRVPSSVTADDADITDLITEAREHCELLTNAALVRSTFVQYLDHFPGSGLREGNYYNPGGISHSGHDGMGTDRHHRWHNEIKVKRPPLVSVQSIWYIGTDGRPYTLNPGQDFIVDVAGPIGRIRPIPYTLWPLTMHVQAAIAIRLTAGYAPNSDNAGSAIAEPETLTEAVNPSWQPDQTFAQYSYQIDANGNVEVQINAGTPATGSAVPAWPAVGQTVVDGGCLWQNYGPIAGFWTPGTNFASPCVIFDFNSNLQLLNVSSLVSQTIPSSSLQSVGAPPLPWSTSVGGLTPDNGVAAAWRCLGPYNSLGNSGLVPSNSPEQQAAVVIDLTLPKVVTRAMKALVSHWYFNREPVAAGTLAKVPLHVEDMLGSVTVHDFAPTP